MGRRPSTGEQPPNGNRIVVGPQRSWRPRQRRRVLDQLTDGTVVVCVPRRVEMDFDDAAQGIDSELGGRRERHRVQRMSGWETEPAIVEELRPARLQLECNRHAIRCIGRIEIDDRRRR